MFDPSTSEDHQKRSIIALLFKLGMADHHESKSESDYIRQVAEFIGLPEAHLTEIQESVDSFDLAPPSNEQERMTILYYLLFLSNVDQDIREEEENLIKKFGFRLGFRPALTDDLISVLRNYANQRIPPNAMVDVIKKYLN